MSNAEQFLEAIAGAEFGSSGGVSEEALRPWWRGRMGLTKEEQLKVSALISDRTGPLTSSDISPHLISYLISS